jgi:hypothetical protein
MKYVTLIELGERLGLDRSYLHKRVKRDRVATITIPYRTKGGVQMVKAVPECYATELAQHYLSAEQNAR